MREERDVGRSLPQDPPFGTTRRPTRQPVTIEVLPGSEDRVGRRLDLAVVALSLLLGWLYRDRVVDDGFIYARYAENILQGHGFVFNRGDPVNASTSILWTFVVAALMLLMPGDRALIIGHVIVVALLGAAISRLLRHQPPWLRTLLVIASVSNVMVWKSVGLDAPLAMLLCAWVCASWERQDRPERTGFLIGMAVLARPDAVLMGGIAWMADLIRSRRPSIRMILAAALPVVPWLAYATWKFGSPVPSTLAAKTAQSRLSWWSNHGSFLSAAMRDVPLSWVLLVVGFAGIVYGWRNRSIRPQPVHLLVAYGTMQALAYTAIGAPVGYSWYFVPLAFALLLWGGLGLEQLAAAWEPPFTSKSRFWQSLPPARVAWCFAILGSFEVVWAAASFAWTHPFYRCSAVYRSAAKMVAGLEAKDRTLAATEIGYLGYYSQVRIVDIHGLIHPDSLKEIRAGHNWWWLATNPDLVLVHEPPWFGEPGYAKFDPAAERRFRDGYELVATFGGRGAGKVKGAGAAVVQLWARRPSAWPASIPKAEAAP
jgi:hypothetical protein